MPEKSTLENLIDQSGEDIFFFANRIIKYCDQENLNEEDLKKLEEDSYIMYSKVNDFERHITKILIYIHKGTIDKSVFDSICNKMESVKKITEKVRNSMMENIFCKIYKKGDNR